MGGSNLDTVQESKGKVSGSDESFDDIRSDDDGISERSEEDEDGIRI